MADLRFLDTEKHFRENLQELADWSKNYEGVNTPLNYFLDMISYSEQVFGDKLISPNTTMILGATELTMIGQCLLVFNTHGFILVKNIIEDELKDIL